MKCSSPGRRALERRKFLRSVGAAAFAAPFLPDLLLSTTSALAAPRAPRRLIILCTAMGTIPKWWQPAAPGPLQTLAPLLAPLQPFVRELNQFWVESGVHRGGGHPAWSRLLTGLALGGPKEAGPGRGASLDQFLGTRIGAETRFPVLSFGAGLNYSDTPTFCRLMHAEGNTPLSAEGDPAKMFARLHGAAAAGGVPLKAGEDPAASRSMFDVLTKELTAVRARLGAEERQKLELHLTALRDVEKQVLALEGQSCPTATLVPVPKISDKISDSQAPEVMKAQVELIANALACNLTRVVSFQLGQEGNGSMRFPFLGHTGVMHSYSHESQHYERGAAMWNIHLWYAEQFAHLVGKLQSVREGDGTLLDNTLVVWLTTMSDGRLHDGKTPVITAGRAGGAVRTGQFFSAKRYTADLLATIANIMGVAIDSYGDPMLARGLISELTA